MAQPKVMVIFGTRPEAIKMAPVVRLLGQYASSLQRCVVVTAQHRSMLDQVLEIFDITPDYDLNLMQPDQSLASITARILTGMEPVLTREQPDLVLVQGDTTTAFIGGLTAFYHHIPVGHIEAGLRTHDNYNPFPEEINRHFLDVLSDLCFAPTGTARQELLDENIPDQRILVTGNTVIDALLIAANRPHEFQDPALRQIPFDEAHRVVLVTAHRRESLGGPMTDICLALRDLLEAHKDLQVIFPVHLNPNVRATVWSILHGVERAWLLDPLDYLDFVHLMKRSHLVVTDSGGIQEEAPALGKPVLVIREKTERPEAIELGTARLVGTTRQGIVAAASRLLDDPAEYARMQQAVNPYGDGQASARIVQAVRHFFGLTDKAPRPFIAAARERLQVPAAGFETYETPPEGNEPSE